MVEDDSIFKLFVAHAETPKGVTAQYLNKVWWILHEDAVKTLDVPLQLNKQSIDALLSKRFSTNDRML